MAQEFFKYIQTHAQKTPHHPAVIDGETTLTYQDLLEQIEKFAGALESLDRAPHSKLGILCLNQKEYLIAYLGALHKGLPVVPFNFLLASEDLAYIAKDAGVDCMVVESSFLKP
nr:acyl--CoA ligase [Nitrospinaceae bacterium]NIR57725.1 acyl--CoA ligase [Nitrospinaceae bacterium]NIS88185.1 acyl--CoA ligase [Nitrospinaceae bacterium]NIT85067.1 acyl--CoA ligase [Nitrospinaceae bacterium]NIU45445.1 acyl--CoA ligase [Nitrospinaceae bacterium]